MKKRSVIIICIVAAVIMCLGLLVTVAAMGRDENKSEGNFIEDMFDNIVDIIVPGPESTTEPDSDPELEPEPDTTIVAEIYVGDDTAPYMQLTREDVIEKINQAYNYDENGIDSNIFSTGSYASMEHGILWKSDVRVEILQDIDIGNNGLRFETSTGNTLTVNGNGHTISGSYTETLVELCPNKINDATNGGSVTLHDIKIHCNGTNCVAPWGDGLNLNLNSCELVNDRTIIDGGGSGLWVGCAGVFNINAGTHITADVGISVSTSKAADIVVSSGALVEGKRWAIQTSYGNGLDMHIGGTVKSLEEYGIAIGIYDSVADINVSVVDGTIIGTIVSDSVPTLNLVTGTLEGRIVGVGGGAGPTVNQKDEFIIVDPFEGEE